MTDDIKKRVEDLRARARAAISEEATDALNAAADTLEAEHQRAETAEAEVAGMLADSTRWMNRALPAEAERDALRAAIQDAYNAWHMESRERAIKILHAALSRAIDTKEKTDEP